MYVLILKILLLFLLNYKVKNIYVFVITAELV